jgi:hypothetical protein
LAYGFEAIIYLLENDVAVVETSAKMLSRWVELRCFFAGDDEICRRADKYETFYEDFVARTS